VERERKEKEEGGEGEWRGRRERERERMRVEERKRDSERACVYERRQCDSAKQRPQTPRNAHQHAGGLNDVKSAASHHKALTQQSAVTCA
jgi:hypothetical protein